MKDLVSKYTLCLGKSEQAKLLMFIQGNEDGAGGSGEDGSEIGRGEEKVEHGSGEIFEFGPGETLNSQTLKYVIFCIYYVLRPDNYLHSMHRTT